MANVNKVMLIGRLCDDPQYRAFPNGGAVCNFRFATNNRRKNSQTGEWEDDPMFIDIKVFNRGEFSQPADRARDTLSRGNQLFVEGKLVLEQWEDKETGQKRSKHVIVADNFQYLEPRSDGGGRTYNSPRADEPVASGGFEPQESDSGGSNAPQDEIPF